jgi:methylated-DNA-protein-cysteine methyltransferase-like protein
MTQTVSPLYQQIYTLTRQIPLSHVSTYGRIAARIGTTARVVGFAMAALPYGSDVPWHRVINAQGKISSRTNADGNLLQKELLSAEGVVFKNEKIELGGCRT